MKLFVHVFRTQEDARKAFKVAREGVCSSVRINISNLSFETDTLVHRFMSQNSAEYLRGYQIEGYIASPGVDQDIIRSCIEPAVILSGQDSSGEVELRSNDN